MGPGEHFQRPVSIGQGVAQVFDRTTERPSIERVVTNPVGTLHVMDPALLEQFRDRWVAIGDAGEVVADSDSMTHLHDVLRTVAPDQHVLIRRIPARGEPLFIGLG
jgi:hypothetical protein